MIRNSRFIRRISPTAGFSMIEVLIALVLFSFGMLALAAFQTRVVHASADAKARTAAIGFAQQRIEQMRGFTDAEGYRLLNSSNDTLTDASAGVGRVGVNFTRTTQVSRFVMNAASGKFAAVPTTATDAQVFAISSSLRPGTEFKRVRVSVDWTDSTGAARNVVMSDTVNAVTPSESARALATITSSSRNPQVRIYDPTLVEGVIPIAVGNDSSGRTQSVAASDPKPVQDARSGLVATRFEVQTFVTDSEGTLVQKRVETAVTSCSCAMNSDALAEGPFEPSSWDGDKFTTPMEVTAKLHGAVNSRVSQDALCTTCCRDHHDTASQTTKFDPFRPASDFTGGDHNHYKNLSPTGAPSFQLVDNAHPEYDEVCRLVRVDGIYRVTTDPRLENLAMLNMSRDASGIPALSSTTKTDYSGFAKRYIYDVWDAIKRSVAQAALSDYTPSPDGLNQTDPVSLGVPNKFNLNGRGLFLDWLSQETIDKLRCAKINGVAPSSPPANCTTKYANYQSSDVLQILPFVAINLTNIGEWGAVQSGNKISMRNDPIPNDASTNFVRGEVTAVSQGNATGDIKGYRGGSGMTSQVPIDPDDAGVGVASRAPPLLVDRDFIISGARSVKSNFVVEVRNDSGDANFALGNINVSPCQRGSGSANRNNPTDPTDGSTLDTNEHLCSPDTAATSLVLTFSNYNLVTNVFCNASADKLDQSVYPPVCKPKHGTAYTANYTVHDFKLCPIRSAITGLVVSAPVEGTNSVSTPPDPTQEFTRVTLTMSPDASIIDLIRFISSFRSERDTCP